MNYKKHYDLLINRGRNRNLEGYKETHHILPRCLGGTDDPGNLVDLTAEEHYVAHQLLIKIYPNNTELIWAAHQMTKHPNGKRNNNKLYGWLRRKNQKIAKQRKGAKNGSYGKSWYYNPETLHNIKCKEKDVPEGYIKGRYLTNKNNKNGHYPCVKNRHYPCVICQNDTGSKRRKYCDYHRKLVIKENAIKNAQTVKEKFMNDNEYRKKTLENFEKGRVSGIKRPRNKPECRP